MTVSQSGWSIVLSWVILLMLMNSDVTQYNAFLWPLYMTHYTAIHYISYNQLFVVDDMVHYRCTAEGTAHVPPLISVFHFCILPPPSVSVWNMSVNWRNPSLQRLQFILDVLLFFTAIQEVQKYFWVVTCGIKFKKFCKKIIN